jgi:dTDP-glucose 4,6-dehydratase
MNEKSTILVTGCAGFIGSHMVDLLLEKGHSVIGVDCFTYAGSVDNIGHTYSNKRFRMFNKNICNTAFISEMCSLNHVQWIVNFAAETHVDNSIDDCEKFIRSNVNGVRSLLSVCKNLGAKMLHVSTDEVYGSRKMGSFTEFDKLDPRNPYSATKASAEHLISAYENTYGTNVVMVRPSNNFGPRQHKEKFLPTIIRSLGEDKKIPVYGEGLNIRDWLFVKDNVKAMYHIMKNCETKGVYNITNTNEMTNIEMVQHVCDIMRLNWEDHVSYVPDRAGHDFRYSIDNTRLLQTGFNFSSDFKKNLKDTIDSFQGSKK